MADWWKPDADTRRALRRWDKVKPVRREVERWEVVEDSDEDTCAQDEIASRVDMQLRLP